MGVKSVYHVFVDDDDDVWFQVVGIYSQKNL